MVVLDDEHPQAVPIPCSTDKPLDMPKDYHPAVAKCYKSMLPSSNRTWDIPQSLTMSLTLGTYILSRYPKDPFLSIMLNVSTSNCSPWCAPAVYIPKSNGEIRICIDFVQLNIVTKKNPYPVPRTEGQQQKLANKRVFSKIEIAYWQFPIHEESIEKTKFCPRAWVWSMGIYSNTPWLDWRYSDLPTRIRQSSHRLQRLCGQLR